MYKYSDLDRKQRSAVLWGMLWRGFLVNLAASAITFFMAALIGVAMKGVFGGVGGETIFIVSAIVSTAVTIIAFCIYVAWIFKCRFKGFCVAFIPASELTENEAVNQNQNQNGACNANT